MVNTFNGWWKPVKLLIIFYSLFIVMAFTAADNNHDPALVVWRVSLIISSLMAIGGLLGTWQVVAHGRGAKIYPLLGYSGVWSMILVEAYHALYVGPLTFLLRDDYSMDGRATAHLALALAIFLVSRRKLRLGRDAK